MSKSHRARLSLDVLEAREVPATLTVGDGFSVTPIPADEGAPAIFRITPIQAQFGTGIHVPLAVSYATADNTARAGDADYQPASGTLQWAAGDRSARDVRVNTIHDTKHESDELVRLNLTGVRSNGTAYNSSSYATIRNNDGPPSISIGNAQVVEGNSGSRSLVFVVSLSHPSDREIRVWYETSDGTATVGDYDYTPDRRQLVWRAGEPLSKTISISVRGDTRPEGDETIRVQLLSPTNATIGNAVGIGTIINDDLVAPSRITVGSATETESNSGTRALHFTVSLDTIPQQTVAVDYQTFDGSATLADSDYRAASGTLTWYPGEAVTKTVVVLINGDTKYEETEQLSLVLRNPENAIIVSGTGTGTIRNDDFPPVPPLHDKPVVFRSGTWYFDTNGDGVFEEQRVAFGLPGDTPILADWDGNGVKDLTVVRANPVRGGLDWYIDLNRDGGVDAVKHFGLLGDIPVAADFDRNGRADMMAVRSNAARGGLDWYIDLDGQGVFAETVRHYGLLGDSPITGDWNGDGKGDMGIIRAEGNQQFAYLDTDGTGGYAEERRLVASVGQRVIAGDWNGDGRTDFGTVTTPETGGLLIWRFDYNGDGSPDKILQYGLPGDQVLAGR